jgi:hypothetical protein
MRSMRMTFVPRLVLALAAAGGVLGACNARETEESPDTTSAGASAGAVADAPANLDPDARDRTCPAPSGTYEPLFVQRSGTCGAVTTSNRVPIDNTITIQKFATTDVETETIIENCTLFLQQVVRDKATGRVMSVVQGSTLEIGTDGAISGVVTLTEFHTESEAASCSGEYQLELRKAAKPLGGAAQ